jgi:hypothetical protein
MENLITHKAQILSKGRERALTKIRAQEQKYL